VATRYWMTARRSASAKNVVKYWMHSIGRKMARLKDYYEKEVVAALIKAFDYKNRMEVPRLEKLLSIWDSAKRFKTLRFWTVQCRSFLSLRTKTVITKARRSIATFKLRQGMSIGCSVTSGKNECMSF